MKIQFTKTYPAADGKTYQAGWVADWAQPDAEAAIAAGYAIPAPEGAYPRKHAAPVFVCAAPSSPAAEPLSGPIEPTGETIAVEDLQKPKKKTIFGHIGG